MSRFLGPLALVPLIGLGLVTSNALASPTVEFNKSQPAFHPRGASGILTGGFMVTTNDRGDSIGLRAIERGIGLLSQSNNGMEATYYAPTGTSSTPPTSNPNLAAWSFDYIVTPGSGRTWSDLDQVSLTITGLDGTLISTSSTFPQLDPMSKWGFLTFGNQNPNDSRIANDSLNLGFSEFNTTSSQFDPYATGVYKFTLSLTDKSGDTISQTMNVQVGQLNAVPEPSTLALAGFGALVGVGYARRRRRNPVA